MFPWMCPTRVERGGTYTNSESITVSVACAGEGDGGGLSNKDVILVLIGDRFSIFVGVMLNELWCCPSRLSLFYQLVMLEID